MSQEFLMERINTAHELLDGGQIEGSLWVLKNIKLRIHEPEILASIKDKESKVENEYTKRYANIHGDATAQMEKLSELNLWRIKELLTFYDTIVKEIND